MKREDVKRDARRGGWPLVVLAALLLVPGILAVGADEPAATTRPALSPQHSALVTLLTDALAEGQAAGERAGQLSDEVKGLRTELEAARAAAAAAESAASGVRREESGEGSPEFQTPDSRLHPYQRGQVYEIDKTIKVTSGQRHIAVGGQSAVGSGQEELPPPVLLWTGPRNGGPIMQVVDGATDVAIDGLLFRTPFDQAPYEQNVPHAIRLGAASKIVLSDLTFEHVGYAINGNGRPSDVTIENCRSLLETGLRAYFVWGEGEGWRIRDCVAVNSTREHIVRFAGFSDVEITGCDFQNMDRTGSGQQSAVSGQPDKADTAKGVFTIQHGEGARIIGNRVVGGGIGVGPLGGPDGAASERARLERLGLSPAEVEEAISGQRSAVSDQPAHPDSQLATNNSQLTTRLTTDVLVAGNRLVNSLIQVNAGAHDVTIAKNTIDRDRGLCIQVICVDPDISARSISGITIVANAMSMAGDRQNFLRVIGGDDARAAGQVLYAGNSHVGQLVAPLGVAVRLDLRGQLSAFSGQPWPLAEGWRAGNVWTAGSIVQVGNKQERITP